MYCDAMKLEKELVAASSVPLVLSILSEGDSYGYAIIRRVRELSGGKIEWTDGMLYPVLHRLEAQGVVAAKWRQSETGRKRRYYTLQRIGKSAIKQQRQQWLVVHQALSAAWGKLAT